MIVSGNSNDRYRQEVEHASRRDAEAKVIRCLCCNERLKGNNTEYCITCEELGDAAKDRKNREALASCPNPEETHFIEPEEGI